MKKISVTIGLLVIVLAGVLDTPILKISRPARE